MGRKQIKIAEVEIPNNYFSMSKEDRQELCNELMNAMLEIIEDQVPSQLNKLDVLDEILISSIETNVQSELYEICQVFHDIRHMIHEQVN